MQEKIEKLFSRNIFIDTNIFIQKNFNFESQTFKTLINLGKEEIVKIFLIDILDKEIISNINKKSTDAIKHIKSTLKQLHNAKANILKPLAEIKDIEESINIIDKELNVIYKKLVPDFISDSNQKKLSSKIENDYKNFLKDANVKIINVEPNCTQIVFDKYFKRIAPFSDGDKKAEFPDAFVLETIESWCITKNEKAHLISDDTGWINFCSDNANLKCEKDLQIIVNLFLRQQIALEQQIAFTDTLIKNNKDKISLEIKNNIKQIPAYNYYIDYGLSPKEHYTEAPGYEICNVDVIEIIDFLEINLIQINEGSATYDILVETLLDVEYSLEDYDSAWYDKEDNKWFNVETDEFSKTHKVNVNIEIELSYAYNEPDTFDIVSITSQDKIEIEFDKDEKVKFEG